MIQLCIWFILEKKLNPFSFPKSSWLPREEINISKLYTNNKWWKIKNWFYTTYFSIDPRHISINVQIHISNLSDASSDKLRLFSHKKSSSKKLVWQYTNDLPIWNACFFSGTSQEKNNRMSNFLSNQKSTLFSISILNLFYCNYPIF